MAKGESSDPLVRLAREAVESHVREGAAAPIPSPVPQEFEIQAGAFVCLKRKGELRGCIGTIEATRVNLAEEIVQNAVSAATRDPRFEPVRPHELDEIEYSVDVLMVPERVESLDELDTKRYGVIVESGYKRGLLLPDLEGVDTVEAQVSIAMRKAGIYGDEMITLYRFEVVRHE